MLYGEITRDQIDALVTELHRSGAAVPQLWHLEVVNVLLVHVRQGRFTAAAVVEYLSALSEVETTVDSNTHERAWKSIFDLAAKHRLSSYDAAYLELAVRKRATLATLDKALARAAEAEGVLLFWN